MRYQRRLQDFVKSLEPHNQQLKKVSIGDHSFSTWAGFSDKLKFLTLHKNMYAAGGKNCQIMAIFLARAKRMIPSVHFFNQNLLIYTLINFLCSLRSLKYLMI